MRLALAALALLAACGRPEAPQEDAPAPPAAVSAAPWFICDGLNAPDLVLASGGPPGATATITVFDKSTGATRAPPSEYSVGESEGAAGSPFVSLRREDGQTIDVRATNSGMLENPSAAYTPRVVSIRMGLASSLTGETRIQPLDINCRWLPRTRLLGFTGRRTIIVHEDADGDLIYTSYDFTASPSAPIDLSENGQTTAFSLEVRDGRETLSPDGGTFTFQADTETEIVVTYTRAGEGAVSVRRHGPAPLQSEQLIATQIGNAEG